MARPSVPRFLCFVRATSSSPPAVRLSRLLSLSAPASLAPASIRAGSGLPIFQISSISSVNYNRNFNHYIGRIIQYLSAYDEQPTFTCFFILNLKLHFYSVKFSNQSELSAMRSSFHTNSLSNMHFRFIFTRRYGQQAIVFGRERVLAASLVQLPLFITMFLIIFFY